MNRVSFEYKYANTPYKFVTLNPTEREADIATTSELEFMNKIEMNLGKQFAKFVKTSSYHEMHEHIVSTLKKNDRPLCDTDFSSPQLLSYDEWKNIDYHQIKSHYAFTRIVQVFLDNSSDYSTLGGEKHQDLLNIICLAIREYEVSPFSPSSEKESNKRTVDVFAFILYLFYKIKLMYTFKLLVTNRRAKGKPKRTAPTS